MATPVYVAISAANRTGDLVAGGEGATYAATFATFTAAFEDATYGARDLVALDEQAIYEMFLDVSPLNDAVSFSADWVTTASQGIIIRAEANSKHNGTRFTGAHLESTSPTAIALSSNVEVEDLRISSTYQYGSNTVHGAANSKLRRCFITSLDRGFYTTTGPSDIISCVIYGCRSYGVFFSNGVSSIINSVIVGNGNGLKSQYGITTVINCVAIDNTTYDFSVDNIGSGSANNASSDASATAVSPVGGGKDNIIPANAFADYLGEDYHLAAGSTLHQAGYDLSAQGLTDIDGAPFQVPFPIGCDEPSAFTVPVELSNVPLGTEVRIFDNASGAELVGVESSAASPVILDMPYPGVPVNARIVLLNMAYRYQVLTTEIGPNGLSFPVTFFRDRVYKNP
jgi:hypothetical protein